MKSGILLAFQIYGKLIKYSKWQPPLVLIVRRQDFDFRIVIIFLSDFASDSMTALT